MSRLISKRACNHLKQADSAPTTTYDWHSLPDELKVEIVTQCVISSSPIGYLEHKFYFEKVLLPLLRSDNLQLATLAKTIYYKENTFRIDFDPCEILRHYSRSPIYPKPATANMIRHLSIEVQVDETTSLDEYLQGQHEEWTYLHKPESVSTKTLPILWDKDDRDLSDSNIINRTKWQTDFTSLQNLSISSKVFWYFPCWERDAVSCCKAALSLNKTKKLLARAEILLRADKVHFDMEGHQILNGGHEMCKKHEDMFKDLEKMATRSKE